VQALAEVLVDRSVKGIIHKMQGSFGQKINILQMMPGFVLACLRSEFALLARRDVGKKSQDGFFLIKINRPGAEFDPKTLPILANELQFAIY